MSSKIEHNQSLNFEHQYLAEGTYRYAKLLPSNSTSQNINLSLNSFTEVAFEIPSNKVINFKRSYLRGALQIPASGADSYNKLQKFGATMIDRIALTTRGGVYLTDIQNVGRWTRSSWLAYTNKEKFLSKQPAQCATADADCVCGELCAPVIKTPKTSITLPTVIAQTARTNAAVNAANTANDGTGFVSAQAGFAGGVASPAEITDMAENSICSATVKNGVLAVSDTPLFQVSLVDSGAQNAITVLNWVLPMEMIYSTLLCCDKDLYFGENLVLTFYFNQGTRIAFKDVNANVPNSINAAPAVLAAAPVLTKCNFQLAVEVDPMVEAEVKNAVEKSGISIVVPYVHSWKQAYPANPGNNANTTLVYQNTNILYKVNRSHGQSLLRIAVVPCHGVESLNTDWSADNFPVTYNGDRPYPNQITQSFYTTLDSTRLQDSNLSCAPNEADDYAYMKDLLEGSAYVNYNTYRQFPTWWQSWHGGKSINWHKDDFKIGGLSLDVERTFNYVGITAETAVSYYVFAVCQRLLTISRDNIQIV